MHMIFSADQNWGIGIQNSLLVSIPADLKYFRELTTGKVVVMGRKTLESLPGGAPLENRTNVVLSKNPDYKARGCIVVHSEEELLAGLKNCQEEVYVIGGESVYKLLLPYCDTAYVTKIDYAFAADAYAPNLDADESWRLAAESEEQTYFNLEYTWLRYERIG